GEVNSNWKYSAYQQQLAQTQNPPSVVSFATTTSYPPPNSNSFTQYQHHREPSHGYPDRSIPARSLEAESRHSFSNQPQQPHSSPHSVPQLNNHTRVESVMTMDTGPVYHEPPPPSPIYVCNKSAMGTRPY